MPHLGVAVALSGVVAQRMPRIQGLKHPVHGGPEVAATLGPKGRNVVLDKKFGSPTVTKDGVTVAKEIELEDAYENMGAQMVREVASKTSDTAGDGTTTATVLAQAIYREGAKNVVAGANPMGLKRGIEKAVEAMTGEIKKMSKPVKGNMIAQVGTISANNDKTIGDIIAEAMEKEELVRDIAKEIVRIGQDLKKCALARTVLANEGVNFTWCHGQRHIVECPLAGERLGQMFNSQRVDHVSPLLHLSPIRRCTRRVGIMASHDVCCKFLEIVYKLGSMYIYCRLHPEDGPTGIL